MNRHKILESRIRDGEFGENVTVVEPAYLYECKIGYEGFIRNIAEND